MPSWNFLNHQPFSQFYTEIIILCVAISFFKFVSFSAFVAKQAATPWSNVQLPTEESGLHSGYIQ